MFDHFGTLCMIRLNYQTRFYLRYESETCSLKETVESYKSQIAELNQDIKEQKDKHDEVLSYSRSLTENVVDSKSMVTDLKQKARL